MRNLLCGIWRALTLYHDVCYVCVSPQCILINLRIHTARAHSACFIPFSFGKYLPMHSRIIIIQIDCVEAQRVCIAVSNIGISLNEYVFYMIFIYILYITHCRERTRTQSLTHTFPSRTLDLSCLQNVCVACVEVCDSNLFKIRLGENKNLL